MLLREDSSDIESQTTMFVLKLIDGNNLTENELEDGRALCNISKASKSFSIVMIIENELNIISEEVVLHLKQEQLKKIKGLACTCFSSVAISLHPFIMKPATGILLALPDAPAIETNNFLAEYCKSLRLQLGETFSRNYSVVYGEIVADIKMLNFTFKDCIDQLIQDIKSNALIADFDTNLQTSFEQALFESLNNFSIDDAITQIRNVYDQFLRRGYLNFLDFSYLHAGIIENIYDIMRRLKIDNAYFSSYDIDIEQLSKTKTLDEVFHWYYNKLNHVFIGENIIDARSIQGSIFRAKHFIHKNLAQPLSLESVSSHINLSPNYFSRCFKEETGKTFGAYLLDIRIEAAKKLLRKGDYKVVEVGPMVGFNDIKYFHKVFRKSTGFSPGKLPNNNII